MSDEKIKVGDLVQSKQVPTLIGRVVAVNRDGTGEVIINDSRKLLFVLDQWRKIRD